MFGSLTVKGLLKIGINILSPGLLLDWFNSIFNQHTISLATTLSVIGISDTFFCV